MRLAVRMLSGAALALALLAAGHVLWWLVLSARLQEGLEHWAAARRAEGWSIAWGTPERAGWPRAAVLRVPDPRLSGGEAWAPGGMSWSAPEVTLRLDLLAPGTLRIEPAGTQTLRVGGADVALTADRLAIALPVAAGAPLAAGSLEAAALAGDVPGAGPLRASAVHAIWQVQPGSGVSLEVRAGLLVLPPGVPAIPGGDGTLRNLAVAATLSAPGVDLADPHHLIARWQAAGGMLTIREFGLDWGPAQLLASATLGLDDRMRPAGAATARIAGAAETLRALAEAGVITPRAAGIASAALPLMTRRSADGRAWTELPLTLRDGTLALGRFPLARLPDAGGRAPP